MREFGERGGDVRERLTALLAVAIFVIGVLVGLPYALGLIGSQAAEADYSDEWGTRFSGLSDGIGFIGPVKLDFPDGGSYSGGFKQGLFADEGRYVSLAGWECEGSFTKGKLTDASLFTSPRGDSYSGGIQDISPHGAGSYLSADGWSYTGQWFRGLPQGEGVFTYPDGSVYQGEFVAGLAEGSGNFQGVGSWSYSGEFQGGLRQGTGSLTLPDGEVVAGLWEAGFLMEATGADADGDGGATAAADEVATAGTLAGSGELASADATGGSQ
ncbi:MAG: hypothetical protein LBH64_03485 [Coriobacteriales bacterium]|nr:hypothetical protein [Coriobacteriales bacterium]